MPNFSRISRRPVPALQATLEHHVDDESGAQHFHLATDDEELGFLVAFPTVPDRSDGRAHILEHVALSGSQRYPVANPFFAMLRRSTATFMNAMTYADRTIYPFASTDRKDFFNLLDVYLDATFFPKLDPLTFLQEGWRYTLDGGQLGFQGVVFNEMKGAYNDPLHVLSLGMRRELFQGTTYAVDSGGDPVEIPSISHAILKAFHASHYHPSATRNGRQRAGHSVRLAVGRSKRPSGDAPGAHAGFRLAGQRVGTCDAGHAIGRMWSPVPHDRVGPQRPSDGAARGYGRPDAGAAPARRAIRPALSPVQCRTLISSASAWPSSKRC
ncbi:insulinase family protein [Aquabacterium sp.]|uniref:insulinase family protein n=1 Tax=Aquabacterium sp. TaxID=1872578 RepID=UPI002C3956DE|nr:insulinase family protein [Aquabacterium sp.]HSW06018.1 insulinase family protein [Aquabacterium sp.]